MSGQGSLALPPPEHGQGGWADEWLALPADAHLVDALDELMEETRERLIKVVDRPNERRHRLGEVVGAAQRLLDASKEAGAAGDWALRHIRAVAAVRMTAFAACAVEQEVQRAARHIFYLGHKLRADIDEHGQVILVHRHRYGLAA